MAAPILPGFLIKIVYPATLTALGVIGNVYILGNQIKEMKSDLKEMKSDLKEVKQDIKGLTAHQTELELHDMFVAGKILEDCGKNK